ncbi:(2Fe-2S) ferredoxin domain-containing protein [Solicola sp. PLA-1-18]|uniref:(2Fe-2S) ferredoxin domain-containing protein n=1 Tax=Solicola sp. PLA-1-18 TaxID=3380532 RepID=UPI003B795DED
MSGRAPDVSVTVCHDCCCGTTRKHPGVDHEAHRAALLATADDRVRVRVVDCLGVCERSNVVLVRDLRRRRSDRDTWLGEVVRPEQVDALVGWVEGRCGPLPRALRANVFRHRPPAR